MSDLYFPPELVNNTISDFIYTYGFAEASLLRGVSSKYSSGGACMHIAQSLLQSPGDAETRMI